jgi:FixJ family two-component response regulator
MLIVTGYAGLEALHQIGDVEVLRKPVDATMLVAAVERALAKSAATHRPPWARASG